MKQNYMKIAALALALVMLAAMLGVTAGAEETPLQNRYNIVFVIDESGSMSWSDPDGYRYEAIQRFVGLMAQTGNSLGSVSFNSVISGSQDIKPIEGFAAKREYISNISAIQNEYQTNIGLALETAVDMLDKGKDDRYPSAIILLSDGNTELPAKEMEVSLAQKADAIERARQAGYAIHTIFLNAYRTGDIEEVKQISTATGGEFKEVSKATDLEDVQEMFYKLIFNAVETEGEDIYTNENGVAEKVFNVPGIGVEEINVVLEGSVTSCELTDPNGRKLSGAELEELIIRGKTSLLIKVTDPAGGNWTAKAYGDKNVRIFFKMLYNSDFYITTGISKTSDFKIGEPITFTTMAHDRSGEVHGVNKYDGFSADLHLMQGEEETLIPMSVGNDGFSCTYTPEEVGTYYAYITMKGSGIEAKSTETYEISVDNQAPVPPDETPTAHANVWPIFGGKATIDLDGTAEDPDGDELTYTIDDTAFREGDYELDGDELTVKKFSISKGSFTVRATDEKGAYCTFQVLFTSTNIGIIMLIAIAVGIILVVTLISIKIYRDYLRTFNGEITVRTVGDGYPQEVVFSPANYPRMRGRIYLTEAGFGRCGFHKKSYFQACGKKKQVYFVSAKPVYGSYSGNGRKKILISSDLGDVEIFAQPDCKEGITAAFHSYMADSYDFQ